MAEMTIRRVIALGVVLFVAACMQQPEPLPVSESEVLSSPLLFEPDHIDMGSVKEGESAEVYLRVRNSGDTMQQIVDVQTSCGCSVAEPEERLIMPGGFTRIHVVIDTFAKQDEVKKWVLLTDAEGRTSKAWLALAVRPDPHLNGSNRSIFDGKCASCHYTPAEGKVSGLDIYAAVCAMCHGVEAEGASAPALSHIRRDILATLTANGTGSQHMPGFAKSVGGPLTGGQIEALSQWLSELDATEEKR